MAPKYSEWVPLDSIKGERFVVESAYGSELLLRHLGTGRLLQITLEDSGLGYGEGGYTEYLQMDAKWVTRGSGD